MSALSGGERWHRLLDLRRERSRSNFLRRLRALERSVRSIRARLDNGPNS